MTSKPHFELAILKENVETKRITFKNQEFESLAGAYLFNFCSFMIF